MDLVFKAIKLVLKKTYPNNPQLKKLLLLVNSYIAIMSAQIKQNLQFLLKIIQKELVYKWNKIMLKCGVLRKELKFIFLKETLAKR